MRNMQHYMSQLASSDATLVVVPGTDDRDGTSLESWIGWFYRLFAAVKLVLYPATVGPVVGGIKADRYDTSCDKAVAETVSIVESTPGKVVLLGYSQGAEAAWRAAATIRARGIKSVSDITLIVWAHPQHPTGVKAGLKRHHPLVSRLFARYFGVRTNGAASEVEVDDITTVSIAITGDPVTAFEVWWRNPVGFVVNSLLGFLMTHSGRGSHGAQNLAQLQIASIQRYGNSSVTYVTLDSPHQLTQAVGLSSKLAERISPRTRPGEEYASIWRSRRKPSVDVLDYDKVA